MGDPTARPTNLWPLLRIPGIIRRRIGPGPLIEDEWNERQQEIGFTTQSVIDLEHVPLSEARLIVTPNRPGLTPDLDTDGHPITT